MSEQDDVHGGIRSLDIRLGDPLSAAIRPLTRSDAPALAADIWRVSPFGIEIVNPAAHVLRTGVEAELTLTLAQHTWVLPRLTVATTHVEHERQIIGMRWHDGPPVGAHVGERRRAQRWRCGHEYLPTGLAPNHGRFNDTIYFRVVDISRTGMKILTSLRNKLILPGMELATTCAFPTLGEARIDLRVVDARVVSPGGRDCLAVGVEYACDSPSLLELMGQYLLQFGESTTVQGLVTAGFRVRSASRSFDFGWVRTESEYQEVLELRRFAYAQAKKLPESTTRADTGDSFDRSSRILVAKHHGKIVGTVRVMFPQSEQDALKHDDYLVLPASLPPRQRLVEISKACTHPEFRGSDLFYSLINHAAVVAIQARRSYILMSCTDGLVRVYAKLGLKPIGLTYVHPSMRLRHHVMLGDVAAIISGRDVNPIVWNAAGGYELWSYASLCSAAPPRALSRARVMVWRWLKPLAFLARWYASRAVHQEAHR